MNRCLAAPSLLGDVPLLRSSQIGLGQCSAPGDGNDPSPPQRQEEDTEVESLDETQERVRQDKVTDEKLNDRRRSLERWLDDSLDLMTSEA